MSIEEYLSKVEPQRKQLLAELHQIIMQADQAATPEVGKLMGKETIIYKSHGLFKYGLASVKNHMSLHVFPIYCLPQLHEQYEALLPNASFQKGCINFKDANEIPLEIIRELITDCARLDPGKLIAEAKLVRKAGGQ